MDKHIVFLSLALISEIIGTVSGFGSSILFVPLASLFFDFKIVLGITAIYHVFSNLTKIALFFKGIDKNIAFKLGFPAVIFVSLGAVSTDYFPSEKLHVFMNGILMVLAGYLILNFNKTVTQNNKNLVVGGIASGFIAGITGTGGAIRGITLASFNLPKDIFIATSALIDFGVDSSRAVIYMYYGYFQSQYLYLIPILIGISIVGSYIGKVILTHTSEKHFRYIVLIVVILTTIIQIVNYLTS